MPSHAVIIGGTGMLMEVSTTLARHYEVVTSVARTDHSLHRLDRAIGAHCEHRVLALDWSQPDSFVLGVAEFVRQAKASPSLVLAWLHQDGLGPRLAAALASADSRCAFFHVRGSVAASPAEKADRFLQGCRVPRTIDYYQVILGFCVENGRSRWLHDSEIAAGVQGAIEHPREVTIVGTVVPWSARP